MEQKTKITVQEKHSGCRLDKFLAGQYSDLSRSFIQNLIEDDLILLNSKSTKPSHKLSFRDEIIIFLPPVKETKIEPENIKLNVIYEDKDLIIVNKLQGMVTHPASSIYKGTLVNALLHHCRNSLSGINGVLRPGIVHRLDKETSGLIIACKNDKAHNEIAKQIQNRSLKRQYLAIVHGDLIYAAGKINKPIGRDPKHRHKMAVNKNGRNAVTCWKVINKLKKYTYLECTLETGRTHQIRVHMASLGHPIVGDKVYGKKNDPCKEMMLHAYKLSFKHPDTKKQITLETKMPERFVRFFNSNLCTI